MLRLLSFERTEGFQEVDVSFTKCEIMLIYSLRVNTYIRMATLDHLSPFIQPSASAQSWKAHTLRWPSLAESTEIWEFTNLHLKTCNNNKQELITQSNQVCRLLFPAKYT